MYHVPLTSTTGMLCTTIQMAGYPTGNNTPHHATEMVHVESRSPFRRYK